MIVGLMAIAIVTSGGANDHSPPAVVPRGRAVVSRSKSLKACKARRASAENKGAIAGAAVGAVAGTAAMVPPLGAAVGVAAGHLIGKAHVHCTNLDESYAHRHHKTKHAEVARRARLEAARD